MTLNRGDHSSIFSLFHKVAEYVSPPPPPPPVPHPLFVVVVVLLSLLFACFCFVVVFVWFGWFLINCLFGLVWFGLVTGDML